MGLLLSKAALSLYLPPAKLKAFHYPWQITTQPLWSGHGTLVCLKTWPSCAHSANKERVYWQIFGWSHRGAIHTRLYERGLTAKKPTIAEPRHILSLVLVHEQTYLFREVSSHSLLVILYRCNTTDYVETSRGRKVELSLMVLFLHELEMHSVVEPYHSVQFECIGYCFCYRTYCAVHVYT